MEVESADERPCTPSLSKSVDRMDAVGDASLRFTPRPMCLGPVPPRRYARRSVRQCQFVVVDQSEMHTSRSPMRRRPVRYRRPLASNSIELAKKSRVSIVHSICPVEDKA